MYRAALVRARPGFAGSGQLRGVVRADRLRWLGRPHLVRRLLGSSYRALLPMSLCVGAALLVTCDAFARLVEPGRELPVGIVTAALGAPTLVFLVARGRR